MALKMLPICKAKIDDLGTSDFKLLGIIGDSYKPLDDMTAEELNAFDIETAKVLGDTSEWQA